MEISDDFLYDVAKVVDNDFNGTIDTFTIKKRDNYFYLTTNRCDWASLIRVYFTKGERGISKVTRLCDDTDGWQEIQPETYDRIKDLGL